MSLGRLGAILLIVGVLNRPCLGNRIDRQFPLGTIGCLFERNICDPRAKCIDDFLFGTCQSRHQPDFIYQLTRGDLDLLDHELRLLTTDKFSWNDPYTQCVLQNLIVSLSIEKPIDKRICFGLLFDLPDTLSDNDIYQNTLDIIQGDDPLSGNIPLLPNSNDKRDEIRVHKYFDESIGTLPKRFLDSDTDANPNYLSYDPRNEYVDMDPRSMSGNDRPITQREWENAGLSLEDLLLVKSYLDGQKEQQKYAPQPGNSPSILAQQLGLVYPDYGADYGYSSDLQPGYAWTDEGDIFKEMPVDGVSEDEGSRAMLGDDVQPMEEPAVIDDDVDMLPPQYAFILDKLIRGDMEPDNLTDEELQILTPFVSKMLMRLSNTEDGDDPRIMKAVEMNAIESNMLRDEGNDGLPDEDMRKIAMDEMSMLHDDPDVDLENSIPEELAKKSDVEDKGVTQPVTQSSDEPVNVKVAFIEMDKPMSLKTSGKLVDALEKIVKARPGSLERYLVEGNKLKINIDSYEAGVNASVVSQLANDHRADLEKATGYKFVKSGIILQGIDSETEVEVKANRDDRYFVLTFVLCGCIAGILLAVVVIYVIRRHTRSKEKLQQLGAAPEGGDAASKDYQDLCRQRMQSKSSEKPEPLHAAASRVGSVSETQVRSPSSRSSTSSWSEEPVNSNMDISTGHIVLSYMEDHLKNKDRLEREWEALCAYEADPCSTKVAEDPANARKGRYGDVMPYDHSRVVMSNGTNVSGSDFINASTITDHDPRNPAYVATQGVLPHTVADFWQMVWEQGSVVVVMLTKLTENGEAMCHRYWPEEGSDLYHIYEVHLVSEHIWCDDYLVRSFYLKNLQTNETRTVTQFHFLTWPDLGIPASVKALLDFRRKVNKSYRGRSCPIVVHCSDGCGRTGTYCLIDMVLNRMAKGAKEIDIAATLEHIRDQRMNMVKTKEQFQFALAAVAEEVHAILKALPQ